MERKMNSLYAFILFIHESFCFYLFLFLCCHTLFVFAVTEIKFIPRKICIFFFLLHFLYVRQFNIFFKPKKYELFLFFTLHFISFRRTDFSIASLVWEYTTFVRPGFKGVNINNKYMIFLV